MPDRLILPPLRRTARDAEAFARAVHADQVDKAGRSYVEHLKRVAKASEYSSWRLICRGVSGMSVDLVSQIAWLHDVIEDTGHDTTSLTAEGFSAEVIRGIGWLTQSQADRRPYIEKTRELCENAPLPALLVKIADTEDNADPERLALLDEPTRTRLTAKYAASLPILRAAVEARGEGT